jgi:hypothetical protein
MIVSDISKKTKVFLWLVVACIFSVVRGIPRIDRDKYFGGNIGYTEWVVNYEFGFTNRGLVGELFNLFFENASVKDIQMAYIFILVLISVLIIGLSYLCISNYENVGQLIFSIWCITCVGSIQQYIYDIPRLDIFGALIIVIGSYLIYFNISKFKQIVVSLLLCFVSVLIHEAFFLWVLPVFLFLLHYRSNVGVFRIIIIFFASLVFTVYVSMGEPGTFESASSFTSAISSTATFEVNETRVEPLFRSLRESIVYNFKNIDIIKFAYNSLFGSLSLFFGAYPFLVVIVRLIKSKCISGVMTYYLMIASVLSPLSLYVVGVDHGRWWAMATFSFSIVSLLVIKEDVKGIFQDSLEENYHIVLMGVIFNILMGPAGVVTMFPKSDLLRVLSKIN